MVIILLFQFQSMEGEGDNEDDESVASGPGQYRTYTPPPQLGDEVAEATGDEAVQEGTYMYVGL